jgi:hypothetical protein
MLYDLQVYLDNRKSAAERGLEAPIRTATLMLARGVKTVVTTTMATTAAANTSFVQVGAGALQHCHVPGLIFLCLYQGLGGCNAPGNAAL